MNKIFEFVLYVPFVAIMFVAMYFMEDSAKLFKKEPK